MNTLRDDWLAVLREPDDLTGALRRRLLEAILAPVNWRKMTYEEFLSWADEDTLAEWVDGDVIMTSPAGYRHQALCAFLTSALRAFAEYRQLGVVLSAPFQMKLASSGREPDLLFVAHEHLDRLQEGHLNGPADLVVEVISPESIGRDRGEKFTEYEEAGIPEYWLIDPLRKRAEFYQLDTGGLYHLQEPDAEGIYHSRVLEGFGLLVAWLWQEPLPATEDIMLIVGGAAYAGYAIKRLRQYGFLPST